MKILVLNSGSSSVKYSLFNMEDSTVLCSGLVERIGEDMGAIKHKKLPDSDAQQKFSEELKVPDHDTGLRRVIEIIVDAEMGVLSDISEIGGVGHRIVHGGESFSAPTKVDAEVIKEIEANIPLAPLHNPGGLAGIKVAMELLPGTPMVVVFDTAFHQTIPDYAYIFPVPYEYYEELRVRRYGFHGTSHKYVSKKTAEILGEPLGELNCVTVHLGNGCSMAAVKGGKCMDTSMGLTPLMGLMMGTRSGDIDPALIPFLAKNKGLTIDDIDNVLNKKSGLKGICGMNDMRDIHAAREKGDKKAQLALEMFSYRVKSYIGSYLAVIGGCDAIVFTAGIGENDPDVRQMACDTLAPLGAVIDKDKNFGAARGEICEISAADSTIKILIVPTEEELEIAVGTMEVLATA
jgi:acetate kinase